MLTLTKPETKPHQINDSLEYGKRKNSGPMDKKLWM